MSNKGAYTHYYDDLPKIAKIIIPIVLALTGVGAGLLPCAYRILRFAETKNVVTLIVGILCIIPVVGFVASIIDLITMITKEQISVLAD